MEPEVAHEVFRGSIFTVFRERWPGFEHEHDVLRHPGAAAVLPLTPSGEVLLVRQFRPAIRQTLIEIPAGLLDVDGEDALTCASRELFEETGHRHETIEFLGGSFTSAGFTDEYVHLFIAGVTEAPESGPEPGLEVLRRPFDELVSGSQRTGPRREDGARAAARGRPGGRPRRRVVFRTAAPRRNRR